MSDSQSAFWVFGYGSLLWDPGFTPAEQMRGLLHGYRRSFCMRSLHHRGTKDHPGLVLALDETKGAMCHGLAFRVPDQETEQVHQYLRDRELISAAYVERWLPVRLEDGREISALSYIIEPTHVQYCGGLDLEEQAHIISAATGGRGPNSEYLYRTVEKLQVLGVRDADLEWLAKRVKDINA